MTAVGVVLFTVVLSPTAPTVLNPQQYAEPAWLMPQYVRSPVLEKSSHGPFASSPSDEGEVSECAASPQAITVVSTIPQSDSDSMELIGTSRFPYVGSAGVAATALGTLKVKI